MIDHILFSAQSCKDFTGAILVEDASCNFDDGNSCKYLLPVYPHLWDVMGYHYGNNNLGIIDGDTSKGARLIVCVF